MDLLLMIVEDFGWPLTSSDIIGRVLPFSLRNHSDKICDHFAN